MAFGPTFLVNRQPGLMLEYPLLGFAPDLPPDAPGVLVDSSAILPTTRGICNGVQVITVGINFPYNGPSLGGATLMMVDGTPRYVFGTADHLGEMVSGIATDVSGTTYAASYTAPWSFAQFGNVTLAVNHNNKLQASTSIGATFADADSAAPKASIVIAPGLPNAQFAMLFDYDDGTDAFGDGIFWSALSDYTDWTPSIATECGNIRITDIGGQFTAAIPYRDGVLAFKSRAMYLGTYVGGAAVWSWQRISSDVGCAGKNAVVVAEDTAYFADANGLWMFDGSYPKPMPGYLQQYWATTIAPYVSVSALGRQKHIRLTYDRTNHRLWCAYGAGIIAVQFLVYHTRSGLWTNYGPVTDQDGASFVRELFSPEFASDDTSLKLQPLALDATAANCPAGSFRLGAHGKTYGMTLFRGMRPQFVAGPSDTATGWVSGTLYYGPSLRNVTSASVTMAFAAPGRFDAMQSARFLSPKLTFTAGTGWEISKMAIDLEPAGAE